MAASAAQLLHTGSSIGSTATHPHQLHRPLFECALIQRAQEEQKVTREKTQQQVAVNFIAHQASPLTIALKQPGHRVQRQQVTMAAEPGDGAARHRRHICTRWLSFALTLPDLVVALANQALDALVCRIRFWVIWFALCRDL